MNTDAYASAESSAAVLAQLSGQARQSGPTRPIRSLNGDPHVPHDGRPGRGYRARPGLVIAVEPWFCVEQTSYASIRTGGRSALRTEAERPTPNTIAITESEPIVLTQRPQ